VIVPLPLPEAPLVIEIQVDASLAVHEHPAGAVTAIVLDDASAAIDACVGAIEKVQGAAACVTVTGCPAIVMVPVRGLAAVFGATV
jgi:hypothetical protein